MLRHPQQDLLVCRFHLLSLTFYPQFNIGAAGGSAHSGLG